MIFTHNWKFLLKLINIILVVFAGLKLKQKDPVPRLWQHWKRIHKSEHSNTVQQPVSLTDISERDPERELHDQSLNSLKNDNFIY